MTVPKPETERARRIEELIQKISALKEQKNKINTEADEWAEKRNKLNEQCAKLRNEIFELKNERDCLNEKVKELKQKREEAKAKIHEDIEEMKKSREEAKTLATKRPSKTLETLQKEVENIDWKIQTTSLSLKEEKELVERVKQLEAQLNIHRKLGQLNQNILELQTRVKALKTESKFCHEKLTETAQKSQEIHKRMVGKLDESKKLKTEADSFHKLFLQAKEKTKPLQEEIMKISNEIERLKEEIRAEEKRERKKGEEALREKIEKQAKEKLRRGEKLTWEEFQLLAEKGMLTQN